MDTPAQVPSTPPTQPAPTKDESSHVVMGILAYLGVLVIIPYLMAKDVPFVKFHIKQGVVLIVLEIAAWVVAEMFWGFWFIVHLLNILTFILSIVGIVNVVQKKEKELPLVGSFAKHVSI
jgi:uncharacterized membrane protein